MFKHLFKRLEEDHYQLGCRDRLAGQLPQMRDSVYLSGYLYGRPSGLDDEIQYFPSVEAYLQWKARSQRA